MARALSGSRGGSGLEAVETIARDRGSAVGVAARGRAGARPGRPRLLTVLLDVLRGVGFEPRVDKADGTVRLGNGPYDALALEHRDLTCGMNLAWAKGVVDGRGSPTSAQLAPEPGQRCVVFQAVPGWTRGPRTIR